VASVEKLFPRRLRINGEKEDCRNEGVHEDARKAEADENEAPPHRNGQEGGRRSTRIG
jgi:hypothetical protein